MRNRTILAFAAATGVWVIGFALGVWFRFEPRPEPAPPRELVKVVEVKDTNTQQTDENARLRHEVSELQSKVAEANVRAQAREPEEAPLPPPVAFPRDIPDSDLPDGFREVLAETVKKCGMGLEVAKVDCSEYPCIAWTRATDASVHRFSMDGCAPWKTAFPQGERVVGKTVHGPDGKDVRFFAWMPMPTDESRDAVMKRFAQRSELVEHELGIEN